MIIEETYHMSEEVFTRIYRAHCHIKYHMRRSLVMSFLLLAFGLVMEYGYQKDFRRLNLCILVLLIICLICNYICDYRIPKVAYLGMYENQDEQTFIKITESGIHFGKDIDEYSRNWNQFDKCYETKDAFLLYQKDAFTMIWKQICKDQVDEVRDLLKERVNHGKEIKLKK